MDDKNRNLNVVSYTIEIWDWKTNKYVADISKILTSDLDIEWVLNDVESVDFSIDLVQFRRMCDLMGVDPTEVLTPYVHDIRIRRNGEYILGAQIVEANISINNNSPATIQIRCTGFLNLFKDRYISIAWNLYNYAEMARAMIEISQRGENLVKNPTMDIDASYWLADNGSLSWTASPQYTYNQRGGAIRCFRSDSGWVTANTQIKVPAGTQVRVEAWVKGQSGKTINFKKRHYATESGTQVAIGSLSANGNWQEFKANYTTTWDNEYLHIEEQAATQLCVDNCFVYIRDERVNSLYNLNVGLGVKPSWTEDSATFTKRRNYQLQNIKDALIDFSNLQRAVNDDGIDFDFSPDRKFNCYTRKGSDKLDIEAVYPGNIHSMNISRSAANLTNKIYNIGSGIGDERVQVSTFDRSSMVTYGTREKVVTDSNVSLKDTLEQQGNGLLKIYKNPTNLPKVVIRDGSINPSNVQVGDSIIVRADGDNYLDTINGVYRIYSYQVSVDENMVETVTLSMEYQGSI